MSPSPIAPAPAAAPVPLRFDLQILVQPHGDIVRRRLRSRHGELGRHLLRIVLANRSTPGAVGCKAPLDTPCLGDGEDGDVATPYSNDASTHRFESLGDLSDEGRVGDVHDAPTNLAATT